MKKLAWGLVLVIGLGFSGCAAPEQEVKSEPFKPSQPPPGWVEEKLKARESAPKPGAPPATAGTSR